MSRSSRTSPGLLVTGATNYEVFVSDDPTFAVITFSANSDQAVYSSTETLAYSTTYYWRVRASAPAGAVTPFVYGIFTTEAKPATATPPITVTQPGPTTITFTYRLQCGCAELSAVDHHRHRRHTGHRPDRPDRPDQTDQLANTFT